jgi:hypothetical protein
MIPKLAGLDQRHTPRHYFFGRVGFGQLTAGCLQVSQAFGFGEELVNLTSESLAGKIFI